MNFLSIDYYNLQFSNCAVFVDWKYVLMDIFFSSLLDLSVPPRLTVTHYVVCSPWLILISVLHNLQNAKLSPFEDGLMQGQVLQ